MIIFFACAHTQLTERMINQESISVAFNVFTRNRNPKSIEKQTQKHDLKPQKQTIYEQNQINKLCIKFYSCLTKAR